MSEPEQTLGTVEVDEILASLRGFGITDTEQLITMSIAGRTVNLRLTNLSPEDEIQAMIANLEIKGHAWVQQMRCDLLARAVSWINGITVTDDIFARCPYTQKDRPIRAILREMFMRWGGQAVLVLWRVYMVHCQRLENSLTEQLPDAAVMTEVEARFMRMVADELKATGVQVLSESADVDEDVPLAETED